LVLIAHGGCQTNLKSFQHVSPIASFQKHVSLHYTTKKSETFAWIMYACIVICKFVLYFVAHTRFPMSFVWGSVFSGETAYYCGLILLVLCMISGF